MTEENKVVLIPVDDIIPNRFQPRLKFNEKELQSLAESINAHGIVSPIIVRKIGDKYEIIAGERRFKAANILGLTTVPCIIRELDDTESAEVAVIENLQRANLTPIEEARSYEKLLNKGLTQEQLAKKLGVSQPTIANKVRLLNLTPEVQDALLHNKISERHARSMLQLQDPELQISLLDTVIANRLTVKQTDDEINKILGKIPSAPGTEDIYNVDVDAVKDSASDLFQAKEAVDFNSLLKKDVVEPQPEPTVLPSVEEAIFNTPDVIAVPETPVAASQEEVVPTVPVSEEVESINPFQTVETPETLDINGYLNQSVEQTTTIPEVTEPSAYDLPAPIPDMPQVESNIESSTDSVEMNAPDVMDSYLSEPTEDRPKRKISTAIDKTRNSIRDLENLGFEIDTEEFDFIDVYQFVIKIKKED